MRFALYDFLLTLLAVATLLFLVSMALPEELPCPVRIPTPMFSTDECDCNGCCCAPICDCRGLSYELALKKAMNEQKPIVVYLNCRVHAIDGAVVCRVKDFPDAPFNVGVVIGVPIVWEDPLQTGMRQLVELYGPGSTKRIKSFIDDHKASLKKPSFIPAAPAIQGGNCGPLG